MALPDDGSANLQPTAAFFLFERAEALGKTVRELLTGTPGPWTNLERYLWKRYRDAELRLQQQQRKRKG